MTPQKSCSELSCQCKHLPITGLPLLVCPSSSSSSLSSILFESKSILFEFPEEETVNSEEEWQLSSVDDLEDEEDDQ